MSQAVCRFYNSTGKCRFGKHCRFSHTRETIETNTSSLKNNDGILSETGSEENSITISNQSSSLRHTTNENGSLNIQTQKPLEGAVPPESNLCRSYAKTRFCRYGKRCRYLHIQLPKSQAKNNRSGLNKAGDLGRTAGGQNEEKEEEEEEIEGGEEVQNEDADLNKVLKNVRVLEEGPQRKICRFYKQGFCHYGNRCRFLHQKRGNEMPTGQEPRARKEEKGLSDTPRVVKPAFQAPHIQVYSRETVTAEMLKQLRETELRSLKRRFPKEKLEIVEEADTVSRFIITFSPTDPDWPYDVKVFLIEVEFPEDYPLQLFKLSLPVDQDLPETVRRFIEVSLREWTEKKSTELETKGSVELIFRQFHRWLDRNMQEMVTEGLRQLRRELTARAAGFEFISAKQLQKDAESKPPEDADQTSEHSDDSDDSEEGYPEAGFTVAYRKDENIPEDTYLGPERVEHIAEDSSSSDDDNDNNDPDDKEGDGNDDDTKDISKLVSPDTERKGTEMVFRNMQLYYFSASILVEKLQLSIQCERCKHHTEFATPPNRVNSVACGKCNNTQLVAYRAVLAHPYSSTFGYLDLEGCTAFDVNLQKSVFSITCMQCNKSSSVKTFIPGRPYETICRGCHSKKKFGADAVKLTKVAPSVVDTSSYSGKIHNVKVKKFSRLPKDPAIQEGKPLPDNGACKHYKKSYRWFRFPCCGKCYPCDVCHDENEGDHDMKFANRMICGFCCKEQPFAGEKPCVACSSALTKVRSKHWEGGKGCRNKISMSRDDAKKYSNMNKTVSRKAQEKSTGKTTKLRHA